MPRGVEVLGDVRERVWAAVRAGAHLRQAAESVGVSYDAARGWLADCGGVIPAPSRAGRPGCAYRRLSIGDRETIGLMLAAGHTVTEIADEVEVHKSTVSRERRRHADRNGTYRPLTAQARAEANARTAHARPRKLSSRGRCAVMLWPG